MTSGLCTTEWHALAPMLVRQFLAETGPGAVAEVGVWRGELSERLLALPSLTRLFMVDPWIATYLKSEEGKWYVNGPGNNQDEMEQSYAFAKTVADNAPGRATIIRLPSVDAARTIPDGSLAVAIIDGNHFRDQVIEDIEAWRPKLRPGGLFVGDDHSSYFPGVQVGVEAVFGDQYHVLGQTWWKIMEGT